MKCTVDQSLIKVNTASQNTTIFMSVNFMYGGDVNFKGIRVHLNVGKNIVFEKEKKKKKS